MPHPLAADPPARERPNVLLISFDDAVSFWWYRHIFGAELQTPNLDRICQQSTAFHAAYAQSPLCGPSRASFMSGRSPLQTGVQDNKTSVFDHVPPDRMWPARLKQAGYFCSSGGKVHHGFRPLPEAAHAVLYSDERKRFRIDIKVKPGIAHTLSGGNGGGIATTDPADDKRYHDAQAAASAISFLQEYDGAAPFYREVGFFSPHSPFITPARFKQMYPADAFRPPDSWQDGFESSAFAQANVRRNFRTANLRKWKKSVRNYFSALSHGDYHLGRVWDALQASRHARNTVVVILTDHGHHLGERNRFGKSTLWEQSALVPLIVHDPADPVARVARDPVALLDVGPTVLDYCGATPLAGCAGQSLRAVVGGGPGDPDRAVPTFNPNGMSIRQGRYRYIRYTDGSSEMYDLQQDWWQQRLLPDDHPDRPALAQAWEACRAAHAAPVETSGA